MNNKVIAHRGNFLPEQPIPTITHYEVPENTVKAFDRAFQRKWGIETDVRQMANQEFVLIHDENPARIQKISSEFTVPQLDELGALEKKYRDPFVAFQIKRNSDPQSGVVIGRIVAEMLKKNGLKNAIIFDATIEEAEVLHREFPWVNLAVSLGEKNYSPTIYTPEQVFSDRFKAVFQSVWADEWEENKSIYIEEMFKKIKKEYSKGRIDVISPELHYDTHPLAKNKEELKKLWKSLAACQLVDGICTDYPSYLQTLLDRLL